jgi:hypothetical protein
VECVDSTLPATAFEEGVRQFGAGWAFLDVPLANLHLIRPCQG